MGRKKRAFFNNGLKTLPQFISFSEVLTFKVGVGCVGGGVDLICLFFLKKSPRRVDTLPQLCPADKCSQSTHKKKKKRSKMLQDRLLSYKYHT